MNKLSVALLSITVSFAFAATAGAQQVNPPQAVPETGATLGLLAAGFIGVAALRRKLGK